MSVNLPSNIAVELNRSLAGSALPDAPVVDNRPLRHRMPRVAVLRRHGWQRLAVLLRSGRTAARTTQRRTTRTELEHCAGQH